MARKIIALEFEHSRTATRNLVIDEATNTVKRYYKEHLEDVETYKNFDIIRKLYLNDGDVMIIKIEKIDN